MKILLINWRCIKNPEAGGAEIHMHEIFRRVAAMGHSVTLVAHHYKGAPKEEIIDGIKVIRVGNKYLFNVQFKSYYKKNLADNNFDLVVDYITKIGKSMFTELPFPLSLYVYLMEKGIPKYYKNTPVFVISPSTKKDLVATGYDEKKVEFLYSGIDQNLFNKKIEKNKIPSLLYIGRLKKYKNLQAIIDAMPLVTASIPDLTLDIAGCGDYEDTLKKLVEEKNLSNKITFHGRVSEEKKVEMMGQAWLFVIMSMMEGWGIVVIESNAAGTPVIGSDVPGLRDSIVDGKTGILSPLNDTKKLAGNIIALINDSDKLQKMSIEAEKWAEKFTWDAAAEHFIEVVQNKFPELQGR